MVVPPYSFFCECWHFVWTFCSSHCYIPISEGFMALGPLNRTSPFLCTIWIVPCSSPINPSWLLLILGWWVGVLWGCKLKFLLDCLCPLTVWRRIVLLCSFAIRQPSWWSKKEPHWYSHRSFIFNDLGNVFGRPWSFTALRDTVVHEPLIDDVCWHEDVRYVVVASHILVLIADMQISVFEDDGRSHILANKRWVASLLLIFILACLGRFNAMTSSMLLIAYRFFCPLPMCECFLWHSSSSFLFYYWSGGLVWVCRFNPNHE